MFGHQALVVYLCVSECISTLSSCGVGEEY